MATSTRRRLVPELPRDAWRVLAGDALSALGTGLTLPFLLVYLSQVRGLDLRVAGLAAGALPVGSLVGNLAGGGLADLHGPRPTLVSGLVLAATGTASIAFVDLAWHAFVACGLTGLGMAIVIPAQDSLLASVVAPEQRSRVFSVRHATLNAGLGIGALLAAAVADVNAPGRFEALYLLDAATFLVFIPVLLVSPGLGRKAGSPAEGDLPASFRTVWRDRRFIQVCALYALVVAVSFGQMTSGFPAYVARPGGISSGALGLVFAANTFTVVVAQLFVFRAISGWRRTRALALACGCWATCWAITLIGGAVSGAIAVATFALAMVVLAIGETLLSPTIPAIVNDLAVDHLRGRYNAMSTLALTIGFMVGPPLAGLALDNDAGGVLFSGTIALCGVAAWGALRLERHLPPSANLIEAEVT